LQIWKKEHLGLQEVSGTFSQKILVEILGKNPNRIWDERKQISAQTDKNSV